MSPMGSAAGGKLAAAVTHAGGLGLVGSGYADAATVTRELVAAGNARVGVGFITFLLRFVEAHDWNMPAPNGG